MAPDQIKKGLNALLPEDILIKEAGYVPFDFHSRYSARSKVYEYRILNRRLPDVFLRGSSWHIRNQLDLLKMAKCASSLIGIHDFSSFQSSGSGNLNPIKTMMKANLYVPMNGLLRFVFEADGFLRHMVRNIVGTIVEVGRGKFSYEDFYGIFQVQYACHMGCGYLAHTVPHHCIGYDAP